jgi:hypothetical protein
MVCVQIGCMLYRTRQARITITIHAVSFSKTSYARPRKKKENPPRKKRQLMCTHDAESLRFLCSKSIIKSDKALVPREC